MDGYMAEVKMFAGNYPPANWAYCQGQLLSIAQYQSLFALLGTQFGGDARTTFALPNLAGRTPIGSGNGPGLSYRMQGQYGGFERNTLSVANLASHNHGATMASPTYNGSVKPHLHTGRGGTDSIEPENNYMASAPEGTNIYNDTVTAGKFMGESPVTITVANPGTVAIDNAGSNAPIDNMQPWLCLNYIICLNGMWPPRS